VDLTTTSLSVLMSLLLLYGCIASSYVQHEDNEWHRNGAQILYYRVTDSVTDTNWTHVSSRKFE
jgi:hypothetical protein